MLKGVDVSYHRGAIDWTRAKLAGVEFAILRLGYGSNIINEETTAIIGDYEQDDPEFINNVAGCESVGIPWGAYLYSYARNLDEAESEVQHILRRLKGKKPAYPIYIDMEDADGYKARNGVSNDMCVQICEYVCNHLEGEGYYAGIYANKDWLENRLNDSRLDRFDKWLAQWAESPTYSGQFGLWQYTSDGTVDGINGRVDRNQTTDYCDYPAYIKENHLNGWAEETTPVADIPAVEPVEEPSTGIHASDVVHYSGRLYGDSYGNNPGQTVDGNFVVDIVKENRPYGVHVSAGWIEVAACTVVGGETAEPAEPEPEESTLNVGDTVRIRDGVTAFFDGTGMADFIRSAVLYVRQIGDGKVLVSTQSGGDVTGWVKAEDIVKA